MSAEAFHISNLLCLSPVLNNRSPSGGEWRRRRRRPMLHFLSPGRNRSFHIFAVNSDELEDARLLRQRFAVRKALADAKVKAAKLLDVVGSVKLQEAPKGAILEDDDDVASDFVAGDQWWDRIPKRWVIVSLCFSAFLLCNMDRVINTSSLD